MPVQKMIKVSLTYDGIGPACMARLTDAETGKILPATRIELVLDPANTDAVTIRADVLLQHLNFTGNAVINAMSWEEFCAASETRSADATQPADPPLPSFRDV